MLQYLPGHTNRLRAVIKHESGKISFKTGSIEVDAWHGSLYSTTTVQICLREPLWITAQILYKSVIFLKIFTIDTHCQWDLTVYCMKKWYRWWTVWPIVHFMIKVIALANRYVATGRNDTNEIWRTNVNCATTIQSCPWTSEQKAGQKLMCSIK